MPNGRPGDHPHYDIVHHKIDVLGGGMDETVRSIDAIASPELNEVVSHLVASWPRDSGGTVAPHGLSIVLVALLSYAEKQRNTSAD